MTLVSWATAKGLSPHRIACSTTINALPGLSRNASGSMPQVAIMRASSSASGTFDGISPPLPALVVLVIAFMLPPRLPSASSSCGYAEHRLRIVKDRSGDGLPILQRPGDQRLVHHALTERCRQLGLVRNDDR